MGSEQTPSNTPHPRPADPGPISDAPRDDVSALGHRATAAPGMGESAQAVTPPHDPWIDTVIVDRYRLLERVGEGGMGAVYRGEHLTLRKRVAVKFLHAELSRVPDVVARFEREAVAAANLEHPNVVAAHDFGKTADGQFFLVMEFVDGGTLRALLDVELRLQPARAAHIGRHIAAALHRAHALGIVHRDLKPDNVVIVEREGDPDFAKVIDFGIAKVSSARLGKGAPALTQAGMVFGTPDYMAPEQALGAVVDLRADLYAFGIMMFEMLTGQRPFDGEDVMIVLSKHMTAVPPLATATAPPGALPPAIDAVFTKILAKSPSERYESAIAFIQALEGALGLPSPTAPGTYPPGLLAPVPSTVATPAFGVVVSGSVPSPVPTLSVEKPTPSTGREAALAAPSPPSWWTDGRDTLKGLASEFRREATRGPSRFLLVFGLLGMCTVLALGLAWASRPALPVSTAAPTRLVSSLPTAAHTPILANATRSSHTRPNALAAPPVIDPTPPTDVPPPTPGAVITGTPRPSDPRADLATRLTAYVAQPGVHALLVSAHGHRGAVIAAFEAMRNDTPNDPFMHYVLAGVYPHDHAHERLMLSSYGIAVRLEPAFAHDPTLVRDVVTAFVSADTPADDATALLNGPLASTAGPALLEVATSATRTASMRQRAINVLASEPYGTFYNSTVRALIELSQTRTCPERLPIVERLGREGTALAVPYLRHLASDTRCGGWFSRRPCNPCLSAALPAALAAIQQRDPDDAATRASP